MFDEISNELLLELLKTKSIKETHEYICKEGLICYPNSYTGFTGSLVSFRKALKTRNIYRNESTLLKRNIYCDESTSLEQSTELISEVELLVRSCVSYDEICKILKERKGIQISKHSLGKFLKKHNIRKREPDVDLAFVERLLEQEMAEGVNHELGYRAMTLKLRLKHHLNISRDLVALAMKNVCPELVEMRTSKKSNPKKGLGDGVPGPMHLWHYDGYEKLARFGFGIHGCVDGYSRKIIWLKVASSNRLSQQVLGYYLNAIDQNGVPFRTRSDSGSENILAASAQGAALGEPDSHIFEPSKANQRIESLLKHLRFRNFEFWIKYLNGLEDENLFQSHVEWDVNISMFVHGPLIQRDAIEFTKIWNGHRIRKKGHSQGVPSLLFLETKERYPLLRMDDDFSRLCNESFGVIEETDPFGINHLQDYLNNALMEIGIQHITHENKLPCYLFLRSLPNPF